MNSQKNAAMLNLLYVNNSY